ncbi:Plasmodium exported protein (Pm-fam-a like), unknown function [Plasmodium malariae]|uniref:Fam-l protein n=1 Tax=Plasmodium malariae TaxID=5858 RepID=A0A1A8WNL6_PLAMA|nr:Plasmodium exported protein (Pm-fam-a like), unknown function [Plasmodium malariae]
MTWYNNIIQSSLNKYLDEKCNLGKLNKANYRSLSSYKQDKYSCIVNFKEKIPKNEEKEKKKKYNNVKRTNEKHKSSCRSSLYMEDYVKNIEKNECGISKRKKYFGFEKKIFKELDYKDYLKNIKTIEVKTYKKLKLKKRIIRISLILLFFLVLMLPILDCFLQKFGNEGLLSLLGLLYTNMNAESGGVIRLGGYLTKMFDMDVWVIKYENIKFKKRLHKK